MIRLIRKWLKAGILEETVDDRGTGQGSVISPLLANAYLHYPFDLWAERRRRQEAHGDMIIVRYADDLVVGFEHEDEARRFLDAMRERFEAFALTLHPDKTRLIEFGRRAAAHRKGRALANRRPSCFWASPTSAVSRAGGASCSQGSPVATVCGGSFRTSRKSCDDGCTNRSTHRGMAETGRHRPLRILRGSYKWAGALSVPQLCDRSLASNASAAEPTRRLHVGPHDEVGG
ncbi:reverse transcriptase domain-containing protein [Bradyrhizobium murdochi]|uniref:reverse transcriptase domain-containing protein n=1 Tax=Bradyrhizobium murdochi TaxID=1038859 RepID=UPI003221650B